VAVSTSKSKVVRVIVERADIMMKKEKKRKKVKKKSEWSKKLFL
jgi:hypothetical protein